MKTHGMAFAKNFTATPVPYAQPTTAPTAPVHRRTPPYGSPTPGGRGRAAFRRDPGRSPAPAASRVHRRDGGSESGGRGGSFFFRHGLVPGRFDHRQRVGRVLLHLGEPAFTSDASGILLREGTGFRWEPTTRPALGSVPRLRLEYTDLSDRRFLSIIRVVDQPTSLALVPTGPNHYVLRIADSPTLGGLRESSSDLRTWSPESDYRMNDRGHMDLPWNPAINGNRFYRVTPR